MDIFLEPEWPTLMPESRYNADPFVKAGFAEKVKALLFVPI